MSALARHFKNIGKNVAGYDRTATQLTQQLISEGIDIHFQDSIDLIPASYTDKENTLVVYTPAIPKDHKEFKYFEQENFEILKRASALGLTANIKKGIAVSGTHGKTSVSTITSYLLKNSHVECSAFLGGISKNFETNYIYSEKSDFVVVEADEFDRSFLQLKPYIAVVTAIDADHLEIYADKENIISSFNQFIGQVNEKGSIIINSKVIRDLDLPKGPNIYTYSLDDEKSNFYAKDITIKDGLYTFDLATPNTIIDDLNLGIPGKVNLENAIVAIACALEAGVTPKEIKSALPKIKGVKRRFDILYRTEKTIYIDDYAHHPEEIKRFLESLKEIFPDKEITGVFQPHLYSRTKDFATDFAESLSLLDNLYLLDIYPARELPIPGVTSEIIFNKVNCKHKTMCRRDDVPSLLKNDFKDVWVTMGAGDIDILTDPIMQILKERNN